MEKTISIRNTEITFSIWDLGGQREFVNMLPLVCNDAVAILFMFDLTRKSTLNSIKEWYRQGRGFNKTAIPFLVGTKYDHFINFPKEEQEEISTQVRFGPMSGYGQWYANQERRADLQKPCEQVSFSAAQAIASMSKKCIMSLFVPQQWVNSTNIRLDLQDRSVKGIRPQMHHPRDRESRRAFTNLSIRGLKKTHFKPHET